MDTNSTAWRTEVIQQTSGDSAAHVRNDLVEYSRPCWAAIAEIQPTGTTRHFPIDSRSKGMLDYFTAIVTPLWLAPSPMTTVTGTALPAAIDSGTNAFTCSTPADRPGASPQ